MRALHLGPHYKTHTTLIQTQIDGLKQFIARSAGTVVFLCRFHCKSIFLDKNSVASPGTILLLGRLISSSTAGTVLPLDLYVYL